MKKEHLFGILFFGSIWGASEVLFGGFLYGKHIAHSSVPLTIIAFMILTIARGYLPHRGSLTLVGSIAMLYKFLNTPFFACHLLGILLLGFSYDLVSSSSKVKNKALFGAITTYLGYILFALMITYVFRYHYWTEQGLPKILRYVGISGTLAAFGNSIAVPVSFYMGQLLKKRIANPFEFRSRFVTSSISLVTFGLWLLVLLRWF